MLAWQKEEEEEGHHPHKKMLATHRQKSLEGRRRDMT